MHFNVVCMKCINLVFFSRFLKHYLFIISVKGLYQFRDLVFFFVLVLG